MDDPPTPEAAQDTPEARFGAVLRQLRVRDGLTLRDLGQQLHRSHSTISDFENGVRLPAADVVEHYEDHFKLPRGTLVAQREHARAKRLQSPRDGTVDEHLGDVASPHKEPQPFAATNADAVIGRENQVDAYRAVVPGTSEADFGAVLRRLRERDGLTLRELGEDLRRSYSTISDFENGVRLPAVDVVEHYEEYFKLARGTLVAQRERARAQRLESPRDGTLDEHLGDVACPYKGLQPFEPTDADLFFGRENQVEAVLERLAMARFVAVVGASGSGKSSFVRAGLLAAITQQTTTSPAPPCVALLTPGEHPLDVLTTAASAATGDSVRVLADELRADPSALGNAAGHAREGGLVIAVDQFEELFTQCDDDAERRCFVDALLAAWRDPAMPVTVIVALRADFYGRIATYPELAAAVVAHQTLIGPLTAVELRRAIELPAAHTGLTLQPGLTDTILEDLAGEPGALPLLSHALLETWKRRRRLMLTISAYRDAGGVRGAIAQTAENTLQSLPEADQTIARHIFLALTDITERAEPTRRHADRDELTASSQPAHRDRVLAILATARLVTIDEHTVTVAHEALIRHWPRLRNWIETDRAGLQVHRQLTAAAREWHTMHREAAALYRGARLAIANEWVTDHADDLSALERDFLAASRATEHRIARRLRLLVAVLATVTATVAVLGVVALTLRSSAQRKATKAASLALAASSLQPLQTHPDVSLALAFEAYRTDPRPEARVAVTRALLAAHRPDRPRVLTTNNRLRTIAFSPDGDTLASAGDDGTVRLWDWKLGARKGLHRLTGGHGGVYAVAFSPDGTMLATAGDDGTVRLWDPTTRTKLGRLTGHIGPVHALAFSPDGTMLASTGDDGTIRLWNPAKQKLLRVLGPLGGRVTAVAFRPDGRVFVTAGDDGTVLWDPAASTPRGRLELDGSATTVAFSPDGTMLAAAGDDGIVNIGEPDPAMPKKGLHLTGRSGPVTAIAFSPNDKTLATASDDRTVRLWDTATLTPLGVLTGNTGPVTAVAFNPHDKTFATLATANSDKTARVWEDVLQERKTRNVAQLHTTVCNAIGPGLTRSAWKQFAPGIPYRRSCP